ncbi:MAG: hypothetical protein ACLP1D_11875 [Xanthobacteraceae bacterium]
MTSLRQFEANRRNSLRSTGPKTEAGKLRSRQNAVRHGLSAETVVEIVEDLEDYKGFEAAIIGDYDAQTAVQRELVLRLASLLWRLRRATSIETDLFRIQAEILRDRVHACLPDCPPREGPGDTTVDVLNDNGVETEIELRSTALNMGCTNSSRVPHPVNSARQLSVSFQRIANFDNAVFERLGRYESSLARQAIHYIYLLRSIQRR